MRLISIEGNDQRLDGGAMFGNCPRPVWEKWASPDDRNRIALACRALLVQEPANRGRQARNVLLETGVGAFFEPKLRERFGIQGERHVLLESLDKAGIRPEDIDVVVFSHLHFDHVGGALTAWNEGEPLRLVFPRASYLVSERAWERARHPHPRDRASFIPELRELLEATGRLELVKGDRSETLGSAYSFTLSDGHTPGLLLTRVDGWCEGPITFVGDLVPGVPWVHVPITMGYDRNPELLIDEKKALLERIREERGWTFFTHDPSVAAARIDRDASGKYVAVDGRAALS